MAEGGGMGQRDDAGRTTRDPKVKSAPRTSKSRGT